MMESSRISKFSPALAKVHKIDDVTDAIIPHGDAAEVPMTSCIRWVE